MTLNQKIYFKLFIRKRNTVQKNDIKGIKIPGEMEILGINLKEIFQLQ